MTDEAGHTSHDARIWTDKEWDEWKDYADHVRVEIRFVSWPGADESTETWVLESDGAAWSKDWLSRELIEIAAADAVNSCCGRGNYMLDTNDKKTEWGASGAAVEAILTLSENLLSEATWLAVYALAHRLSGKLKERNPSWSGDAEAMSDEQARDSALWELVRSRGVARESLDIRSVEFLPDGEVLVVVREESSGVRYTVEVKSQDWVRVARIRKIAEPD